MDNEKVMRRQIYNWMLSNYDDFIDHQTGEINVTQLAVSCATGFDCQEWLDDDEHLVWDIAVDVAIEKEISWI